jgi:RNA polymerase sigma-70 factor (ECF subfamily)
MLRRRSRVTVDGASVGYEDLFRSVFEPLVAALAFAAGSREAAADAVQDAFIQAYRHWEVVSSYDNPGAWVRRVAVNRIANQHRSRQRYEQALAALILDEARETDPGERLAVIRALAALGERERVVVALYYLADLPVSEVAEICELSGAAVKTILLRARRRLAVSMGAV